MSVIGFGDKFQSPGCRLLVNCARKHHKQAVLNPKKLQILACKACWVLCNTKFDPEM